MPPLGLLPGQPRGATDIVPGSGADNSAIYGGSGVGARPVTSGRQVMVNGRGLYWGDGSPITEDQFASLDDMWKARSDEDARRYGVDNRYRYDVLKSTDRERAAARADAKRRLAEEQRQYDLSRQDRNYQFGVNTGVDLLKTGAQMRGPLNFIQGDMFAQGANGISPFLQSLRTGQPVQFGGGTATQGNPVPLTVSTLADAMSGGGGAAGAAQVTGSGGAGAGGVSLNGPGAGPGGTDQYGRPRLSPDAQAAVDATAEVYKKGIANMPLGWWESFTPDQQDAFRSASDYLGRSTGSELAYLKRSRPGQMSASSA